MQRYRSLWMDCDFGFVACTAEFSHLGSKGEPVFKDCRGNYGTLRNGNRHKLKFASEEAFNEWFDKQD